VARQRDGFLSARLVLATWTLHFYIRISTGTRTLMLDLMTAAASASAPPAWIQFLPFVGMILIFWFLIIRPQMKRQKEHQEKIGGLKKGDRVVTAGGLIGKIVAVREDEVELELARDVRVKAVKSTIGDVILPKASND